MDSVQVRSGAVLLGALAAVAPDILSYSALKDVILQRYEQDPMDCALSVVTVGSCLFYLAEREINPKVNSLADAFVFITTCMSVGYSDIFAKTEAGKAIAATVMSVGPGLSAGLFERPRAETEAREDALLHSQGKLVERIEALITAVNTRADAAVATQVEPT